MRSLFILCLISTSFTNSIYGQSKFTEVKFYGLALSFDVPSCFSEEITYYEYELFHDKYEKMMSKNDMSNFLRQLKAVEQKYRITDFFLFQVIARIAEQVSPDANYRELMLWYLAKQLDYTVAIGTKEGIYYFLPAYAENLEGLSFFKKDGVKYYFNNLTSHDSQQGALGVYPSNGKRKLYYFPSLLPLVSVIANTRVLNFFFKEIQYEIHLQYDYAYVAMCYNQPGLPVGTYLNSFMSDILKHSLHDQLDPIIQNFNQENAVSFILAMVQYGMPYRTDGEQMGEEKYFLPDEFLHYHFSDCEDKSIFFKKAIEELLRIDTRILLFDKHVAPVVNLSSPVSASPINIDGKNYYYCETTGKGYQLGQIPNEFKGKLLLEWK